MSVPDEARAIRAAILCGLVILFDGFDAQALSFAAPALSHAWGAPASVLAPAFSAGLAGMMIGAVLLGALSDQFGRRAVLLAGSLTFAAGALVTPLAHNLAQLMAIRLATGIGLGGVLPASVALVTDLAPPRLKNLLVMVMFSAISIGSGLGGIAAALLIPHFGWGALFFAGGVLPLLAWPLLLRLPASAAVNRREAAAASLFSSGRTPVTLLLWLLFLLSLMDLFFLNSWLPTLFAAARLSGAAAVLVAVLFQLGGAGGSFVLGGLMRRWGAVRVLAVNALVGAAAIAAMGWSGGALALLAPATLLAGGCVIGGQGGLNAMAGDFYPPLVRGAGVGWALGIGRIGSILGPLLGGLMLAAHAPASALFSVAALPQLGAALLILLAGIWARRADLGRVPAAL